ncbi:MAG: response regulator [Oscillospiraceae bacterium]
MLKVLVADDEMMEREAMRQVLMQNFGHKMDVRLAENGKSAMEIACLWKADLILMDIEMPGTNGLEATRIIKAQLPTCRVIFVTAYGLFNYAQEAVKLGAEDYILKPAEDKEIVSAVEKVIARIENREESTVITDAPLDKTSKIMKQVDEYLHRNYMHDISLDSVSQIINFSPFYFSKLFKQHFETNFIDYLTDIRIETAKDILKDPTKSAKDIGAMVGYVDPNYFAKIFKKKTGMTPTEYRNQV